MVLASGRKEQIFSITRPYLYGLGVAVKLTNWFEVGANHANLMGKQNLSLTRDSPEGHSTNAITGLEATFTPNPEIMISAEYAHSIYDEDRLDDTPAQKGNGFQVNTSLYSEQLSLDTSYERAGEDFFFIGQLSPGGDYEEYDLSLDYLPLDYINATFFYYQYQTGLSGKNEVLKITTGSGSLSLIFPALPVLTINYDIDKTYNSEEGDALINDSNILSLGLSYPFKKMRFSINYSRSDYKSRVEPFVDEATTSVTLGIAIPWGRRVTLSPSYTISEVEGLGDSVASDSRSMSLTIRYQLISGKIIFSPQYKLTQIKSEKDRIATSLGLSYFFTRRSILQLRYGVTGRGPATNWKEKVPEQGNFSLDYTYEFDPSQRLVLRSTWMSSRDFESETSSEKSNLSLSYKYHF